MKEILIFKQSEKKSDKAPDFRLMTKVGDKFMEVGAGWSRKSAKGTNFISCLLSKPYKERKGWHLEEDKPENQPELTKEEEFINM